MPGNDRSILRVEGKDDRFVIEHLLSRHGIDHAGVDIKWPEYSDASTGGRNKVLAGMKTAVTTSTGQSVGFVLNADEAPENRWRAVRDRLEDVGLALPDESESVDVLPVVRMVPPT